MDAPFIYRDCRFTCSAEPAPNDTFQPRVLYEGGLAGIERLELPQDTEAYASEPEAMRHAEQQAMRWIHDRTGDGQGQF